MHHGENETDDRGHLELWPEDGFRWGGSFTKRVPDGGLPVLFGRSAHPCA